MPRFDDDMRIRCESCEAPLDLADAVETGVGDQAPHAKMRDRFGKAICPPCHQEEENSR